jgi:hypothetical protein
MTYPAPTIEQMFIIGVALLVPLVWAFTHHGNTRILTLVLTVPFWLFVSRVVYLTPSPNAPLEVRLNWAWYDLLTDPLTVAWPVFVLLTFGLIKLFTWPRRRREDKARKQLPQPVPGRFCSLGWRWRGTYRANQHDRLTLQRPRFGPHSRPT